LLRIRHDSVVTWAGKHRPPIEGLSIYPRPFQDPLPIWIAIGGTPASVERAGRLGLPLALAIIGGEPERFAPLITYYRESARRAGHDPVHLEVGINSHAFIADTSGEAADAFYAPYAQMMSRIGRERGWPPMTRAHYDAMRSLRGSLVVGSPAEVVEKILFQHEIFGHQRFLAQLTVGTMPHSLVMRAIELLGTKVAPEIRKALGSGAPVRSPAGTE